MLPDWEFDGDEAKREAFIDWAIRHLLTVQNECGLRWMQIGANHLRQHQLGKETFMGLKLGLIAKATAGQAVKPLEFTVIDGLDAALHDMRLLKWIFQQNWPSKNRYPASDRANAAFIAARLHYEAEERRLGRPLANAEIVDGLPAYVRDFGDRLNHRYKKYPNAKGRKVADDDIAFIVNHRNRCDRQNAENS